MNAWWLAIDLNYCSYAELNARRVIAQGWLQLGDLRPYESYRESRRAGLLTQATAACS